MTRIRSLALLTLVGAPLVAQQPGMMRQGMMPHMMQMQLGEHDDDEGAPLRFV